MFVNKIKKLLPNKVKNKVKKILGIQTILIDSEKEYKLIVSEVGKLEAKNVVVTGGSGAIGRAICIRLAAEGATVFVGGRNRDKVQIVVDEIRKLGKQAEPFIIDVLDEGDIEQAFSATFTDRSIDVIVNCAGGGSRENMAPFEVQTVSVIDSVLNTNLRGTMLCTREAIKYMPKTNTSRIVIISSAVGVQGKANYSEYSAAKSGMFGFVKSLALELGKYGITVNCVTPGFIQRGQFNEGQASWLKKTNCLNAIGTMEDVGNAVCFIVSDEAKFITGQNLCVDGGRTLGLYGDS